MPVVAELFDGRIVRLAGGMVSEMGPDGWGPPSKDFTVGTLIEGRALSDEEIEALTESSTPAQ